jgi:uncharacterized protein YoxC
MTGTDLSWIMYVGVGVGVLLVGIGTLWAMIALAKTLGRVNVTLDELDRQISTLSVPVNDTLGHVGGIADTADVTLARLGGVVKSLEDVAGSVSQTASLTKDALQPAIVNVGATITGVSAGLRRLVTGRKSAGES